MNKFTDFDSFFDLGVVRVLQGTLGTQLVQRTNAYGDAFEHFLILEFHRLNSYLETRFRMSYFMTKDGGEIDLILDKPRQPPIFIELKSTDTVHSEDLSNLKSLQHDGIKGRYYCLSRDQVIRVEDEIKIMNWQQGLEEIFPGNSLPAIQVIE